jgi:hypothetical protein
MQDLLTHLPDDLAMVKGRDKYLLFRNSLKVVIRICRSSRIKNGERRWTLGGCDGTSLVLAALMNVNNTEVETLFLLPPVPGGRCWFGAGNPVLASGLRITRLHDFAETTNKLLASTL